MVSAVTAIVQVDAPASAYSDVTVGVPTRAVVPTPAPRLITPSIVQPLVLPPPVTPEITSPLKKYALLLGRITWFVPDADKVSEVRTVAVASVVCLPKTNSPDCAEPTVVDTELTLAEKTTEPFIDLVEPLTLPPIKEY